MEDVGLFAIGLAVTGIVAVAAILVGKLEAEDEAPQQTVPLRSVKDRRA